MMDIDIKKAWEPYLLLVPLVEALELPFVVERTEQKPHAEYDVLPTARVLTPTVGGYGIST